MYHLSFFNIITHRQFIFNEKSIKSCVKIDWISVFVLPKEIVFYSGLILLQSFEKKKEETHLRLCGESVICFLRIFFLQFYCAEIFFVLSEEKIKKAVELVEKSHFGVKGIELHKQLWR